MSGVPKPITILVVEDEPANQELVRAIIASSDEPLLQGSNVLVAGSLAEARAYLGAGRVDIILLDVGLPDGDGLGLVKDTQAMELGRPRTIVVSGSVFPMERHEALATGADDFVAKPLEPKHLVSAIVHQLVPRTVLVVEDYEELSELIREALTVSGFRVLVAAGGPAALEVAQSEGERVDLLLTDLNMPSMMGTELAKRLSALHPHLRVILMSGEALPVIKKGLPKAYGVLQKPFMVHDLLETVRETLAQHDGE
jgi:CheY-like chemotaxis protein